MTGEIKAVEPRDPELSAITVIAYIFRGLSIPARLRVINFVHSKYVQEAASDAAKEAARQKEQPQPKAPGSGTAKPAETFIVTPEGSVVREQ